MFEGNQDDVGAMPDLGAPEKKNFFQKIFSKGETAIPIILVVVLLIVLVFAFGNTDYSNIPLIGGAIKSIAGEKMYSVLVVGQPDAIAMSSIYGNNDFTKKYRFVFKSENDGSLERYPENTLNQYDFIIIDQTESTTSEGQKRTLPYQFTKAITNYVKGGKSVMFVGNSGHLATNYDDAYGWKATYGNIVPMDCSASYNLTAPCEEYSKITITGVLENTHQSNVLDGIEQFPTVAQKEMGVPGISFSLFNVNLTNNSKEWMSIKDIRTNMSYPGILVSNSMLGGKVVYLSFQDYGRIPDIMQRLFTYLL